MHAVTKAYQELYNVTIYTRISQGQKVLEVNVHITFLQSPAHEVSVYSVVP